MRFPFLAAGALIVLAMQSDVGGAARVLEMAGKTFTSTRLGVALDYPDGWAVEDDGEEVTFRAANGRTIVLAPAATDNRSEPAPGRRTATPPPCTTTTNAHAVVVTVCVERSAARRALLVVKRRDGSQSRLAIRAVDPDVQALEAILSSARPLP
jgi:predicted Zn-dependent protease